MAAVIAVAVGLAVIGPQLLRARQQREAKRILQDANATVVYHWQGEYVVSPYPAWLEHVLGEDFFGRVQAVCVPGGPVAGEVPTALEVLRDLEYLSLNGSAIADEDLVHIADLHKLRYLDLGRTNVSDSGLQHIGCLCGLEELSLHETNVTDAGLKHLGALNRLRFLDLSHTHITDAAVLHIRQLKPLEKLELYDTEVTSAGYGALKTAIPQVSIGIYLNSQGAEHQFR